MIGASFPFSNIKADFNTKTGSENDTNGFTLLEILIALTVFAFASISISRSVTIILKQKKKIERDIQIKRIQSNTLELLRQDLKGVFTYFDMNGHLNRYAPRDNSPPVPNRGRKLNTINPQFDFFGEENRLTFTTLSSVSGGENRQLIKTNYFFKSCSNPKTGQSSGCLVRGVSRNWKDREDVDDQKERLLGRGMESLEFAYRHPEKDEWEKTWDFLSLWKEGEKRPLERGVLLPSALQVNIQWESGGSFMVEFPISHPFLRIHHPSTLSPLVYLNFPDKSLRGQKPTASAQPASAETQPAPNTPGPSLPAPRPNAPAGKPLPPFGQGDQ